MRKIRQFYLAFGIRDSLRPELTWSHYRLLIRVDDNPTIGLILCSEKNEAVVKYSVLADAKQIFASKYEVALPKPEELEKQIKLDRALIEERINENNSEYNK